MPQAVGYFLYGPLRGHGRELVLGVILGERLA